MTTDWIEAGKKIKKPRLLFAVVPSLFHACLADRHSAACKPLRGLKGYISLATVIALVRDQPLLLFYPVDKHKRSHARPLPAIITQI